MIGSLDIHRALVELWDAQNLDVHFKTYWTTDQKSRFFPLQDEEAAAGCPFPYCVFRTDLQSTESRSGSSDGTSTLREYRRIPLSFTIHEKDRGLVPAKNGAATLAEEIMKVFGGHPTVSPGDLSLTHGGVLLCQYVSDYGNRTSESEHQWNVDYTLLSDIPVAE